MPLRLIVNGEERLLEDPLPGCHLADFVATLQFRPDRVAVERNGEIVPRSTWHETVLQDGDKLEVVHFVGGGSSASYRRDFASAGTSS